MDAQHVANNLNRNQRKVMRSLNISDPVTLGCIETVAFNLCRTRKTRPALTKHCGNGSFMLTADGAHVRAYL